MAHSQFDLLRQRRFLPYFTVQAFGAFNDNVFRQAIIGLLGAMVAAGTMDPALRGTYAQLAGRYSAGVPRDVVRQLIDERRQALQPPAAPSRLRVVGSDL